MSGIRVWLDMSTLFSGVSQQSCVFVNHDKCQTVKDVQDHIRRVFSIDGAFHILNDGFLLPPSESSHLIRDNDCVTIISSQQIFTDKKQKSTAPTVEEAQGIITHPPGKSALPNAFTSANTLTKKLELNGKEKPALENFTFSSCQIHKVSVPSSAPFLQTVPNESVPSMQKPVKESVPSLQTSVEKSVPLLQKSTKESAPSMQPSNGHPNETQNQDLDSNSETDSGRKRKRIRRRKKKPCKDLDDEPKAKEPKQSPYILNKYIQGVSHVLNSALAMPSNNKKHIFFQDENDKEPVAVATEPVCKSTNLLKGNENLVPTPTSCSIGGDLSKLMSLGNQKGPAVFERRKRDEATGSKPERHKPVLAENPFVSAVPAAPPVPEASSVPAIPPASPVPKLVTLDSLPVKETTIKFKILKMVNYSPIVSEEITARVISPDFTSNQLFVQILEGLSELQTERGKFSLDDGEGEESDAAPSEYMYLNFLDLIDPKAVQYNQVIF